MSLHHPFRTLPRLAAISAALLVFAAGPYSADAKDEYQIRIACASSLVENQEVILATRADGKTWRELGKAELRASAITGWLPAQAGELHLAVREGQALKSICRFTCPADSKRGLVILAAVPETKTYSARFMDAEKANFVNGTILVLNFSTRDASVLLGPDEQKIGAGLEVVVKPTIEDNGMFRMQVTRTDATGKSEACYDRYVPGNKDSRDLLFLLPDPQSGIRVMSLSLFSDPE